MTALRLVCAARQILVILRAANNLADSRADEILRCAQDDSKRAQDDKCPGRAKCRLLYPGLEEPP